jgi:hypothetical protein
MPLAPSAWTCSNRLISFPMALEERFAQVTRMSPWFLMHKGAGNLVLVRLVHPGGPFWSRAILAWSVPKAE